MKLIRSAGVFASIITVFLLTGCGDVYRPVVIPNTTNSGNPENTSFVFVFNQGVQQRDVTDATGNVVTENGNVKFPVGDPCKPDSPESCLGSASDIDVAGDVNMGNHVLGRDPWSGLLLGAGIFAANRGENTISIYTYPGLGNTSVHSGTLPSSPFFIGSHQSDRLYAAIPACLAPVSGSCPNFDTNTPGTVAVFNTSTLSVSQTLQVGKMPVAVVQTSDTSKFYVVNQADNPPTVSVFSALGNTHIKDITLQNPGDQSLLFNPVWAIATADNRYVFVLSRGGTNTTVSVIDIATDTILITVPAGSATPVVTDSPSQNPMVYIHDAADPKNAQRLYVTNQTDGQVRIFDTSGLGATPPTMPLKQTVTVPPNPFSVAVLSDGSRAYVLSAGNGSVDPSVSFIDANSFAVSPVPNYSGKNPRAILASSDGTKIYVVNHDAVFAAAPHNNVVVQQPGTTVIRTVDNSKAAYIKAPFQDPANCRFDTPQPWVPNFPYSSGDTVIPTTANPSTAYQATTTGQSGTAEPTFSSCTGDATSTASPATCTITDGGIVWRPIGSSFKNGACPRQRPNFIFAQ